MSLDGLLVEGSTQTATSIKSIAADGLEVTILRGLHPHQPAQRLEAPFEHSFLPGDSLWERVTPEKLEMPVAACRGQLGAGTPTGECATLVRGSEKARQEWELERRFHIFEASF